MTNDEKCEGTWLSIKDEREKQDRKWGVQRHDDKTWLAILMEEVGEIAMTLLDNEDKGHPECLRNKEIIQVAAVCVAWMEGLARDGKGAAIWSEKQAPTEQEPLAVLADRKGYEIAHLRHYAPFPNNWEICLRPINGSRNEWVGEDWPDFDTYAAAEQAARNWLMGLEDKV